jgi:hypothetical protein
MQTLDFNQVLDNVDALSWDEQEMLIEIIRKRLIEAKREQIAANIAQAKLDYESGNVFRGSVDEIMAELTA